MQIKCIAIDDEPLALKLIQEYASKFPILKLLHVFNDPITGAEFLRNNPVDLLFIDINMPDISGLEVVRSLTIKPMVVFTTAYKKFAYEGFELDALDYLLKPISFERFSKTISKAAEYYKYSHSPASEINDSLFVRSDYQLTKINLKDIEYIESVEDYIKIYLSNSKPVMTLMTMKAILDKLPPATFQRIHRSYIVSIPKIKAIIHRKVKLTSVELPVSDSYSDIINRRVNK